MYQDRIGYELRCSFFQCYYTYELGKPAAMTSTHSYSLSTSATCRGGRWLCMQETQFLRTLTSSQVCDTVVLWSFHKICKTLRTLGRHQSSVPISMIVASYCSCATIGDDRLARYHMRGIGLAFESILASLFVRSNQVVYAYYNSVRAEFEFRLWCTDCVKKDVT